MLYDKSFAFLFFPIREILHWNMIWKKRWTNFTASFAMADNVDFGVNKKQLSYHI